MLRDRQHRLLGSGGRPDRHLPNGDRDDRRYPTGGPVAGGDRRPVFLICAALFLLVFASRAWLAHVWGSGVPFWDEWDAEAVSLYRPWLQHTFTAHDLFAAQNEHRIVFTRLTDLAVFLGSGRWDLWPQLVINAVLHGAIAAALVALFWRALTPVTRIGFALGVAVLFMATAGWQNALHGFQTQVFYANLLAVGAVAGLIQNRPFSFPWWLGWCAAFASLACFASGVFASMAVIAVMCGLRIVRGSGGRPDRHRIEGDRDDRRYPTGSARGWFAIAVIAVIPVVAWAITPAPAQHEYLHPHSLGEFVAVVVRCLGWPHVNSPFAWVAVQLPAITLLFLAWRRAGIGADLGRVGSDVSGVTSPRARSGIEKSRAEVIPPTTLCAADRCALALVVLAFIHAAAIAYGRGGGLPDARPLSRYQDTLLLGAAAQLYCALRLTVILGRTGRLIALGWSAIVAVGLLTLTTFNLTVNLPYKRAQDVASLGQIRAYLANHDATVFTRDPLFPGPHPDHTHVEHVLDDPVLRPVLPSIFFSTQPESGPGMQPWIIEHARALFAAATLLFIVGIVWYGRLNRWQRP